MDGAPMCTTLYRDYLVGDVMTSRKAPLRSANTKVIGKLINPTERPDGRRRKCIRFERMITI